MVQAQALSGRSRTRRGAAGSKECFALVSELAKEPFPWVTTYLTDQLLNFSNQHSPIASAQLRFTISTINSVLARTTTESRQHFSSFITLNAKGWSPHPHAE